MAQMCLPLGIVTGGICPNYKICRRRCVLSRSRGEDFAVQPFDNLKIALRPKKFLIIGGGVAGIACANILSKHGHKVTIAESESELGGTLHIIPPARLARVHIENLINHAKSICEVRTNCRYELTDIPALQKEYDKIILATGTPLPRKLDIEGEDLPIVTYSSDYLRKSDSGKKVVVIGGGDVAMDCAIHACESGAETKICYRKTRDFVKANKEEIKIAETTGVKFRFEYVPTKITADGIFFTHNAEKIFSPCDRIVVAIGQTANLPQTQFNNVYTVGDANLGPSSVAAAVTQAKALAYKLISE